MSQNLIDGFLAAVPLPSLLVDQSERILGSNSEVSELFGMKIRGRHFATVLRQPGVISAIEACLKDQKARNTQHLSNNRSQETSHELTLRYVSGIGEGNKGAVLLTFVDVTERVQANHMRRDFVANVSHELRTPLTALMGFIETLRGAAKDDANARDRFLSIMEGEASRMNRLVGDLLSLNRVESQERVRPRTQVDLSALLRSTLLSLEPLAKSSSVELILNASSDTVTVLGDPDQLQQVFTNLVENAIKYGGDEVQVKLLTNDRDPALRCSAVTVQVIDNGPGIDSIHLPRLTERFYRADNHRSRELGGTGLGLAIVKHITNRHRGRFRVESVLGQGSRFCVTLPL
ncbi:two-component sensor histidine kinase [Sedimentitalea sp. CY04]|uniref:histidine kinase n=1 Tax=Parasedimentitalea denitrificans TaxID=2211118 RepID=A0ABX0WD61_9RHOB|nr:ATP-binding protein [Sedimentitalea sp. CY04]NIZ62734.1 two-component sensor histidine kinase [Sedimentitalea sp. CY04]